LLQLKKNKNELIPEVVKMTNANRAYYAVLPLVMSQTVFTAEKIKIRKT
jgi:hypothetical protein